MSTELNAEQYLRNNWKACRSIPLYTSREDKPRWAVSLFKDIFSEAKKILDVGCDQKQLGRLIPGKTLYTGIDIQGNPDIKVDLDREGKVPFDDKTFDLVFCAEVLEHLEGFHLIFDELCRVSSKYLLISLPNALAGVGLYYANKLYSEDPQARKVFGRHMKFYGLPLDKPVDRHRWFFNTEEAIEFIIYRSRRNNFEIEKVLHTIDCENKYINLLRYVRSGFSRKRMTNKFNNTTWFLIRRKE